MNERRTPCLVIGSGIAGLATAVTLAERGIPVTVMTAASQPIDTNTWLAQGGIIYASEGDPDFLVRDILEAGGHTNYRPAVDQLARKGPELVRKILIEKAHAPFERDNRGELSLTREAAHSESRILYSGDTSGRAIEEALCDYARKLPIEFVTSTTAVNLLMTSFHAKDPGVRHGVARCFGAFVFDQTKNEIYPMLARHTVLATGGIGQLYLHSTNSHFARGDGIALAHRAHCRLSHLEFVQFHPTTFFHPSARRFLISEALRGEGAVLINVAGERFLKKFLPEFETPELAPRDKVAWAINQELISSGATNVFLDISHRPADWIKERFPFVHQSCLKHGVDITRQPIPVVPSAHYHVGGVWTDLQGRTSVPHLWAAGEVACTGVHGFNRLASTSLLEGLVWGAEAAHAIADEIVAGGEVTIPAIEPWHAEQVQVESSFLKQDWLILKHTMWNYVGLIKSDSRLSRAEGILEELARGIEVFYQRASLTDALIGLRHASLVAQLIVEACRRNPRSEGCYLREDVEI